MFRTAKLALVGTVTAVALVPLGASPAAADISGHEIHGGCFMFALSAEPIEDNPPEQGLIGVAAVTTNSAKIPIGATVFCEVRVNTFGFGAVAFPSVAGSGVEAGVTTTWFAAHDYDSVSLCQRVLYDDGVDTGYSCRAVTQASDPPQAVYDAADEFVFQPIVDPLLCPVLKAHAGTYAAGVLTIKPDGDVYESTPLFYSGQIYDCPTYGGDSEGIPINTGQAFHLTFYFALPPTS